MRFALWVPLIAVTALMAGDPPNFNYDFVDEVTIEVQVVRALAITDANTDRQFMVETREGRLLDLFVAPRSYMDREGIRIPERAHVRVTGVIYSSNTGRDLLIAREIQVGHTIYLVRDPSGHPIWEFVGF